MCGRQSTRSSPCETPYEHETELIVSAKPFNFSYSPYFFLGPLERLPEMALASNTQAPVARKPSSSPALVASLALFLSLSLTHSVLLICSIFDYIKITQEQEEIYHQTNLYSGAFRILLPHPTELSSSLQNSITIFIQSIMRSSSFEIADRTAFNEANCGALHNYCN